MQERDLGLKMYNENKFRVEDRIMRSLGVLSNAVIMTSGEAMNLISDVRWGVNMGIIKNINLTKINELIYEILPGGIVKKYNLTDANERDLKRAEILRNGFGE